MGISGSNISCGVWEICAIEDIEESLGQIVSRMKSRISSPAFIIWSNVEIPYQKSKPIDSSGHKFARFVDGRFGKVTKSEPSRNPNTGNQIVIWQWTLDHMALEEWYAEKQIELLKKK